MTVDTDADTADMNKAGADGIENELGEVQFNPDSESLTDDEKRQLDEEIEKNPKIEKEIEKRGIDPETTEKHSIDAEDGEKIFELANLPEDVKSKIKEGPAPQWSLVMANNVALALAAVIPGFGSLVIAADFILNLKVLPMFPKRKMKVDSNQKPVQQLRAKDDKKLNPTNIGADKNPTTAVATGPTKSGTVSVGAAAVTKPAAEPKESDSMRASKKPDQKVGAGSGSIKIGGGDKNNPAVGNSAKATTSVATGPKANTAAGAGKIHGTASGTTIEVTTAVGARAKLGTVSIGAAAAAPAKSGTDISKKYMHGLAGVSSSSLPGKPDTSFREKIKKERSMEGSTPGIGGILG